MLKKKLIMTHISEKNKHDENHKDILYIWRKTSTITSHVKCWMKLM